MARKGEIGPLMWLIIGLLVLLAITGVIIALKAKSFGIIDSIRNALGA